MKEFFLTTNYPTNFKRETKNILINHLRNHFKDHEYLVFIEERVNGYMFEVNCPDSDEVLHMQREAMEIIAKWPEEYPVIENPIRKKLKGMLMDVYRAPGCDCTNRGVTSRANQVLLVGDCIPEIFEAGPDDPILRVVKRNLGRSFNSKDGDCYLHAVPVLENGESMSGTMMGGNFIYTCDSRMPTIGPMPVHDRKE